jgi:sugar diacid utilization regulator
LSQRILGGPRTRASRTERPGPLSGSPSAGPCGADAYQAALCAFGTVAEALGEVTSLEALLHLIAMRICELAGVRRCSVYLRDEETGLFRGQVAHPERVGDERIKRLVAGVPADRFTQEIVESKRPVALANALDDPRPIHATMRAWHIRSMLGVPMVLRGEVTGIMFLDNEGESHTFSATVREITATFADLAAVAVSQARMTTELRRSVATIARQNKLLRQAAAVDERLTSLVVEGADLAKIAAAVAELTAKPTSIHDCKHRRLAVAQPPWLDERVIPRLLEPGCVSHPSVVEALEGLSSQRGGVIGPLPSADLHHRFLVAPVIARGEGYGHLVIMEYGSRFGPLELHVARRAATKIALELAVERRTAAAEWDARVSLAADLICGTVDDVYLERRARYLGIDPTRPRAVCLITGEPISCNCAPSLEQVYEGIASVAGSADSLVVGVPEGAVALIELEPEMPPLEAAGVARRVVERALDVLDVPGLRAAISSRCTLHGDCAQAFEEARQVMTCLRSFSRSPAVRVLTADDLGAGRLLLASSDRTAVRRFAQDALGMLLTEDDATRALLTTLQTFFDSGRSVRRSAVVLAVHENTVRYRLARIHSATGLAVATSSEDQLRAQLALLVLRLEGALPAAASGSGALPGASA